MLFSTPFFLFVFLPIFFLLYWLLPGQRWILLFGSLVFYGWSEPIFLCVVLLSALIDWILGRFIFAWPEGRGRKWLVGLGVANNLGMLVYAKYTVFAISNLNLLLGQVGFSTISVPQIALPLGVSFIVFEKITYVVDLYRREAAPASSFLDYVNYVFLFPKLLAGPIIKYHDISRQLVQPSYGYSDVREGLIRFITGLGKKVLIADSLAPVVDEVFKLPGAGLDASAAWIGLSFFLFQLYFDFSGYSDMAIGLARMMGFRLLENFRDPLLATSLTNFWQRWHISLTTWIRDYLYRPLRGRHHLSPARTYLNLWICFVLCGLWHGAAWNFVIFGCFHGLVLVADRTFWMRWQRHLPRLFNIAFTTFLLILSLAFFRSADLVQAGYCLRSLVGLGLSPGNSIVLRNDSIVFFVIALIIVYSPLLERLHPKEWLERHRWPALTWACVLFLLCVGRMTVSTFEPFLYFRF
jgi:alginate O-acetyltransferase complex protein AlgI